MGMTVLDVGFLLAESREHPTHIAMLQLLRPPPDAGPEYVSDFHRTLLASTDIAPRMRRRPVRTMPGIGQLSWAQDEELDMDYHVRLSCLPRPGRVRELLALVSRLHGTLLDRQRPLWEMHVIEGLADGRFAIYTKVHHALMDGVTAMNRMNVGLATSPGGVSVPPWAPMGVSDDSSSASYIDSSIAATLDQIGDRVWEGVRSARVVATEMLTTPPAVARALVSMLRDEEATLPFEAPKMMFNVPIGGARRFAAQSWSLERVRAVGKAVEATVNDVAVAMCAGALRRYLSDAGELPDRSLVAFLPVSLRAAGLDSAGCSDSDLAGNSLGGILCDLATDQADAGVRLAKIRESTRHSKSILSGLNPTQTMVLTSLLVAGAAAAPVPGLRQLLSPPFNVIISNVPGSREKLYWNGAELLETYPVSIPADGQALNITLTSYAGQLSFGIIGCRRSVPRLQRLLEYLDAELEALEHAVN
jgi:diacylglycerol O-acyltransferase / wax synthase